VILSRNIVSVNSLVECCVSFLVSLLNKDIKTLAEKMSIRII